jgi:hypothetical protein
MFGAERQSMSPARYKGSCSSELNCFKQAFINNVRNFFPCTKNFIKIGIDREKDV